ncbi:hypothetical protein [Leptospira interrogans]|uniref:hypothetical protein n=1 Tax=Leptospira interrogans TaxID=173 RepID=UPI0007730D32|nr:hypothetical protein [Leptospira interrogans]
MNKAPFFGKAVVPTFYPFARLCKTIWVKTNLLFILNRLTASKLYSESLDLQIFVTVVVLNAYRHQSYIQILREKILIPPEVVLNAYRHQSYIQQNSRQVFAGLDGAQRLTAFRFL